mmetsp:Transcript_7352/g.16028  ORF Transcript_7352/g.16028 Transcript_7352/m.16028 type:complete len:338 (-) Transcript_7352:364-1377(-)
MGRQSGIKRGFDQGMRLEHIRDLEGILAVPLHAYVQRSNAAHEQVRVHRIERRGDELLHLREAVAKLGTEARHRSGEDVGVAAEVLRAGLDGDVDSRKVQRAHVVRRGEGSVDHDPGTVGIVVSGSVELVDGRADSLEIGDATGGVGGRLAVDDLGILAKCGAIRLRPSLAGSVDEVDFNSPVDGKFLQKLVRAAVYCIRKNGMISLLQNRHERTSNTRHARTKQQRPSPFLHPLQRGNLLRTRLVRRTSPSTVHESILVGECRLFLIVQSRTVIGIVESVGGSEVDWRGEAAVGFGGGVVEGGTFGGEVGGSGVFAFFAVVVVVVGRGELTGNCGE